MSQKRPVDSLFRLVNVSVMAVFMEHRNTATIATTLFL